MRFAPRHAVLALCALVVAASGCEPRKSLGATGLVARSADELFLPDARVIPTFEIDLPAEAWASLEDKQRKFVRATFRYGSTTLRDVGVRLKGHRAMRKLDDKPAFKIEFDRFVPGQRFLGLRHLTLNNLVEDPTMLREALGYQVFRAAGVPAPRTGYAELRVNGVAYGLYLDVESVDDVFLARELGEGGNLYEGEYGCDLYPDDVPGFDVDAGDDLSRSDLEELAAAAGSAGTLLGEGSPLDVPRVLAYLAVSAVIGDFDGYRHSHNFRIYRSPATGRWVFLPWGLDRVFKQELDVYDSGGLVARLCFADASCRAEYAREVHRVAGLMESLDLPGEMDRLAARIDAVAARDGKRPYDAAETGKRRQAMRAFLATRPGAVRAQAGCVVGGAEPQGEPQGEIDADGDGYGCADCNDLDPTVNPGAAETCDGVDNDCSGLPDDAAACPCPAQVIGGVTFYLCDLPMTWADAAAFCTAQGHTLARIDDKKQSRKLYDAARRTRDDRWWIGLGDRAEEGAFRWIDGTPVGFTRWAKHQPDNDGCNEDCVALKDDGKGKWHDTHCGQRRPFVCR